MSDNQQLAKVERGALQRASEAPTAGEMLKVVIEKAMTLENVAVIKELMAIQAERDFAQAFVNLQADMPSVSATKAVPNNDGTVRYKYAPVEEIMKQVGPFLKKHGFTLTFSTDFSEGRLIKICELQHSGGHIKQNKFAVRVGSGPPKASEAQADGAASSYAKRFALCDCLNIQIDHDNDARAEGGAVTADQAFELERRVKETNSDVAAFLRLAGAPKFTEIPSSKYAMLDGMLAKKEGRK